MARSAAATIENNFVNGHVTEATALNFPEAACTETWNCVFNQDGSFERRKGIDFETGYEELTVAKAGYAINTYRWDSAGQNGDNTLVVLQVGLTLYFYVVASDGLSTNRIADTIDLTSHIVAGGPGNEQTYECQFASGKGYLFVTHPFMDPVYVEYDATTEGVAETEITVKVRDIYGLDDGLDVDERPTVLSDSHKYNLYNQGWAPYNSGSVYDFYTVVTSSGAGDPVFPAGTIYGNNLATWDSERNDFPSNADVWWLYRDANWWFQPNLANATLRGGSPAPKGYFILDAFNKDRSAATNYSVTTTDTSGSDSTTSVHISGLTVESAGAYRPKTCAFFSGRVWYAGVDTEGFNNTVYFSQIVGVDNTDFGKCYQVNDPTSEHAFDALDTDGGTIQILDCGKIHKLVALQSNLIIFASNGIWTISGSVGVGFKPTDFQVQRISSLPIESHSTFVDVVGMPMFWTSDGVYVISSSNQTGGLTVTALSEKKNKSFFVDDIPAESKKFAKGWFNPRTKVVQWLYRSTAPSTINERYENDRVLCFNTVTQAFYNWKLSHDDVRLGGIISIQTSLSSSDTETVTVSSVDVTVSSTDVFTFVGTDEVLSGVFKYLTFYTSGSNLKFTWAEEFDTDYLDFTSYDSTGVDYDSYVVSGYRVRGDAQRKFQSNYIVLFLDMSVSSILQFASIWDYANDANSGDFTNYQYIDTSSVTMRRYKFRRLKIRGSGLSLQFRIQSRSGEPFKVVGWSTFDTANNAV